MSEKEWTTLIRKAEVTAAKVKPWQPIAKVIAEKEKEKRAKVSLPPIK